MACMIVESKVGVPIFMYTFDRAYWNKDDDLLGFKIPYNCYGSLEVLFSRFQLWQNYNGICVPGREHTDKTDDYSDTIYNSFMYNIESRVPIFVGDTINGNIVNHCRSVYNFETELYTCYPAYGKLPPPRVEDISDNGEDPFIPHLKDILELIEKIMEKSLELLQKYHDRIMKTAGISLQIPILPTPTPISLSTLLASTPGGPVTGTITHTQQSCLILPDVMEAMKQEYQNELKEFIEKTKKSMLC